MYVALHGALVQFMALRKMGYNVVLRNSRPVIAYSVRELRGGTVWNNNVIRK
jgi:hypothetical protein